MVLLKTQCRFGGPILYYYPHLVAQFILCDTIWSDVHVLGKHLNTYSYFLPVLGKHLYTYSLPKCGIL